MKKILNYFFQALLLVLLVSCEDNSLFEDRFTGTWVSGDNSDTLKFKSEGSFTKTFSDGIDHTFEYIYTINSITIRYNGPNLILVQPTTHDYHFKNNELMIDFSDGAYGFSSEKITYLKQ